MTIPKMCFFNFVSKKRVAQNDKGQNKNKEKKEVNNSLWHNDIPTTEFLFLTKNILILISKPAVPLFLITVKLLLLTGVMPSNPLNSEKALNVKSVLGVTPEY